MDPALDFIPLGSDSDEEEEVAIKVETVKEEIEEIEPNSDEDEDDFHSVDPLTPLPTPPWIHPSRTYSNNFITL